MKKTLCALAVLSTTSLPALAASVDVAVIGTITPASCEIKLPGGDKVDYGVIDPSTLSGSDYTTLAEKQIDITLNCDALAKMGLRAIDGRPGTMAGVTAGASGAALAPVPLFGRPTTDGVGLGTDGADKIGGYAIRLAAGTVSVDSNPVDLIAKTPSGTAWAINTTGSLYLASDKRQLTWATTGSLVPVAFKSMTGKIGVQAYINKKSELDLSKPVLLDGLTTIEMFYL